MTKRHSESPRSIQLDMMSKAPKKAGVIRYSKTQKLAFVERAAQIVIRATIKEELGYPHGYPSAHRWCKQHGGKPELSVLQAHAAKIGKFYGVQEKLTVLQELLDETYGILVNDEVNPMRPRATRTL